MERDFEYFQIVYPKIIETLKLVAASSEIQLSLFPRNVDITGEIADLAEDAVRYSKILTENKYLTQEQFNKIKKLDDIFENFNKEDWTILSLQNSTNWKMTREFAMNILQLFSVEYTKPNLYWIRDIN